MSSQPTRLVSVPRSGRVRQPSAASRWIDARLNDAASAMAALSDALRRRRRFVCFEQPDGGFVCKAPRAPTSSEFVLREKVFAGAPDWRGGEVEFRLAPQRCVFRELDLPMHAAEFLEGVVRAQVDRITPWRSNEAAFGWSAPEPRDNQRIAVWVAAAKLGPIAELADAAVGAGAVFVTTRRVDSAAPIEFLACRRGNARRSARWRFVLLALIFAAMAAGLAAMAAQYAIGAELSQQSDALTAKIVRTRALLLQREHAGENPAAQALRARKRGAVSVVITLEALSRALPDTAYLTNMRLDGEKLEIAGVAANTADLIRALENSPHFAHATFTAPTVISPQGKGETFRIEARVAPLQKVAP